MSERTWKDAAKDAVEAAADFVEAWSEVRNIMTVEGAVADSGAAPELAVFALEEGRRVFAERGIDPAKILDVFAMLSGPVADAVRAYQMPEPAGSEEDGPR